MNKFLFLSFLFLVSINSFLGMEYDNQKNVNINVPFDSGDDNQGKEKETDFYYRKPSKKKRENEKSFWQKIGGKIHNVMEGFGEGCGKAVDWFTGEETEPDSDTKKETPKETPIEDKKVSNDIPQPCPKKAALLERGNSNRGAPRSRTVYNKNYSPPSEKKPAYKQSPKGAYHRAMRDPRFRAHYYGYVPDEDDEDSSDNRFSGEDNEEEKPEKQYRYKTSFRLPDGRIVTIYDSAELGSIYIHEIWDEYTGESEAKRLKREKKEKKEKLFPNINIQLEPYQPSPEIPWIIRKALGFLGYSLSYRINSRYCRYYNERIKQVEEVQANERQQFFDTRQGREALELAHRQYLYLTKEQRKKIDSTLKNEQRKILEEAKYKEEEINEALSGDYLECDLKVRRMIYALWIWHEPSKKLNKLKRETSAIITNEFNTLPEAYHIACNVRYSRDVVNFLRECYSNRKLKNLDDIYWYRDAYSIYKKYKNVTPTITIPVPLTLVTQQKSFLVSHNANTLLHKQMREALRPNGAQLKSNTFTQTPSKEFIEQVVDAFKQHDDEGLLRRVKLGSIYDYYSSTELDYDAPLAESEQVVTTDEEGQLQLDEELDKVGVDVVATERVASEDIQVTINQLEQLASNELLPEDLQTLFKQSAEALQKAEVERLRTYYLYPEYWAHTYLQLEQNYDEHYLSVLASDDRRAVRLAKIAGLEIGRSATRALLDLAYGTAHPVETVSTFVVDSGKSLYHIAGFLGRRLVIGPGELFDMRLRFEPSATEQDFQGLIKKYEHTNAAFDQFCDLPAEEQVHIITRAIADLGFDLAKNHFTLQTIGTGLRKVKETVRRLTSLKSLDPDIMRKLGMCEKLVDDEIKTFKKIEKVTEQAIKLKVERFYKGVERLRRVHGKGLVDEALQHLKVSNKTILKNSKLFEEIEETILELREINSNLHWKTFKKDPARGNIIDRGTIREARAGVACEKQNLIPKPLRRDHTGRAEFIDAMNQPWDVKTPLSYAQNGRHVFNVKEFLRSVTKELRTDENIILNISYLEERDLIKLYNELSKFNENDLGRIIIVHTKHPSNSMNALTLIK